jgi:competence protein ComEC
MAKRKKNSKFIRHLIIVLLIFGYYYIKDNQESYSKQDNPPIEKKEPIQQVTTDLSIHYIDVGQADSILIKNKEHSMLIDAGNNADGPLLVDYLKEQNITKIDYVVGTHPHEDHIGGLDDIINNFEIQEVYLPEVMTTTKTFEDVLDSIENNNLEITIPTIGDIFKIGEMNFEVIYTGTDEKDLNASSIVLKMTFGNHSYLFTGDTTEEVEKTFLDKNINIDILKVAHHGSKYSTCNEFLKKATPTYAIISVGEDNSYNHPELETLTRLKQYTKNIYMTKDLGTIILNSDGTNINITNIKTNTNG